MFAVPKDSFEVSGETTTYTHSADSGTLIHRYFCSTCGTTTYIHNESMPEWTMIPAGTLDDPDIFKPQVAVYTSRAASWDCVPDHMPTFPEMPPGANSTSD